MSVVRSLAEVASRFGKNVRTAQRWKRAGLPRAPGGYDLERVEEWLKTKQYQGASFRALAEVREISELFELAIIHLRQGAEFLFQAVVKARGKGRGRLINRLIREILVSTMRQASLWQEKGGESPE